MSIDAGSVRPMALLQYVVRGLDCAATSSTVAVQYTATRCSRVSRQGVDSEFCSINKVPSTQEVVPISNLLVLWDFPGLPEPGTVSRRVKQFAPFPVDLVQDIVIVTSISQTSLRLLNFL